MDDTMKCPTIGGAAFGYLFEFKPEGVFLTVYPSSDPGILFELSDMIQILKEYGVADYDIELLARTVRETAGEPRKVGAAFTLPADWEKRRDALPEEKKEIVPPEVAKFTLEISKDRMSATVHFDTSQSSTMPARELILEAAQANHIVFGIDEETMDRSLRIGNDFVLAQGVPPQNGIDAKIDRKFTLGEKGRPVKNKYDQVDYKNLNLFVLAKKGDVLAIRVPQTAGTPGTNIFGDAIPAKNGKPKPLPNGKNTSVLDENTIVADIDGQIVDKGNRISVDPRFDVSGDVGVSTGNIDFLGSVSIRGSVQQGFTVKATGDIEVKGMVSGGTLEGQNVYITGGVQGMNRGIIKAKGDVRAAFAENAEIQAGGNIYISDVVLHSELRAGRKIIVEGRRGLVTGGSLAAGEEIQATIIGNQMYVATKLTVGVNPMLMNRYREVCKEYGEAKKRLSQIQKTLNTLGKIDINTLPKIRVDQINALTRSQFPLAGKVQRDEKMLRELEVEMQGLKNGKVRVSDTLYPGVKISINSILKNVQAEEKHCTLYVEEDFIKTGAY